MKTQLLSPAAQAVLNAAYALPLRKGQPNIAASLRAVVAATAKPLIDSQMGVAKPCCDPSDILAIANELDPQP